MIKKAYLVSKKFIFDLIFPCQCVGCVIEGNWVCEKCLKTIDIIKNPFCPECRRPTQIGEFCENCRSHFDLDGIFICANFSEGVLMEAIHQFKYNGVFDIGGILGKIMAGKIGSVFGRDNPRVVPTEFDFIIPVPLHEKRKRWRGFNQAEILSRVICQSLQVGTGFKPVPTTGALTRKKYTQPQMELNREQRLENLKDVFEIVGTNLGLSLQDKNILLVDDITTTGATLEECAKVLKKNGARAVWGIVLAKGK